MVNVERGGKRSKKWYAEAVSCRSKRWARGEEPNKDFWRKKEEQKQGSGAKKIREEKEKSENKRVQPRRCGPQKSGDRHRVKNR